MLKQDPPLAAVIGASSSSGPCSRSPDDTDHNVYIYLHIYMMGGSFLPPHSWKPSLTRLHVEESRSAVILLMVQILHDTTFISITTIRGVFVYFCS